MTWWNKEVNLFCELRQEFIDFFVMHKTEMTFVNVVKNFQREGIKLGKNF